MNSRICRTICWTPLWNDAHPGIGMEHMLLSDNSADSIVLGIDDAGRPFRFSYSLEWSADWHLRSADMNSVIAGSTLSLSLQTDGKGKWQDGVGKALPELDGCTDIDIWPTPFTNSFPIRRCAMHIGQRREFRMAWVCAPEMTVQAQPQAYTRLSDRLYLFESLNGSGFKAELAVDEDGIVLDYPGLFQRVEI